MCYDVNACEWCDYSFFVRFTLSLIVSEISTYHIKIPINNLGSIKPRTPHSHTASNPGWFESTHIDLNWIWLKKSESDIYNQSYYLKAN